MAVRIRLQRNGRKRRPFYSIVVADSRSPRDGRYIEKLGTFNPNTHPATTNVDIDRAVYWLMTGAQPSDTTRNILSKAGVMYKKHLQVGVAKGAKSQEEADAIFNEWMSARDAKFAEALEAKKKAADEAVQKEIEAGIAARKEAEEAKKKAEAEAIAAAEAAKKAEEEAAAESAEEAPAEEGEAPADEAASEE